MDKLVHYKEHIAQNEISGKSNAGFEVPDGYFDSLQTKLENRLIKKEVPVRKISWLKITAMAASICLILSVAIWMTNDSTGTNSSSFAMADMTSEETIDYIMEADVDEWDTDDILELENIDEILSDLEEELIFD